MKMFWNKKGKTDCWAIFSCHGLHVASSNLLPASFGLSRRPDPMAVQMGKYSEIVDVCQQKYILCAEIFSTPRDFVFARKNIFNSPGILFLLAEIFSTPPDFIFAPKTFLCVPEIIFCATEIFSTSPDFFFTARILIFAPRKHFYVPQKLKCIPRNFIYFPENI